MSKLKNGVYSYRPSVRRQRGQTSRRSHRKPAPDANRRVADVLR